ncbi:Uncharacterised protein [Mycobacterium tuberculosis]|nr:Uncharacterised protein [Mycobacterium tuberculosis]
MVELLAEGGSLLGELTLQRTTTGREFARHVFDGVLPGGEQLHEGGTHTGRNGVLDLQLGEPAA